MIGLAPLDFVISNYALVLSQTGSSSSELKVRAQMLHPTSRLSVPTLCLSPTIAALLRQ